MNTILRYELSGSISDIELPVGYKILSVGVADAPNGKEVISIWVNVDVNGNYEATATETVRFLIFGTGADMDSIKDWRTEFIGTVRYKNAYAYHVFKIVS